MTGRVSRLQSIKKPVPLVSKGSPVQQVNEENKGNQLTQVYLENDQQRNSYLSNKFLHISHGWQSEVVTESFVAPKALLGMGGLVVYHLGM